MIRRPPRSTLLTHSFPTRRSSDLPNNCVARFPSLSVRLDHVAHGERRTRGIVAREAAHEADAIVVTAAAFEHVDAHLARSEEPTSELQSLMRISYAVFCLKKTIFTIRHTHIHIKPTYINQV